MKILKATHILKKRLSYIAVLLLILAIPTYFFFTPVPREKIKTQEIPQALSGLGLTKFAKMIKRAEMVDELSDSDPFTCFAPTNSALAKMPEDLRIELEKNPKSEATIGWIKYHFVPGKVKKNDMMLLSGISTSDNRLLRIWVSNGKITLNRVCEFSEFDIAAKNGFIHILDRVLDVEDEANINKINR